MKGLTTLGGDFVNFAKPLWSSSTTDFKMKTGAERAVVLFLAEKGGGREENSGTNPVLIIFKMEGSEVTEDHLE